MTRYLCISVTLLDDLFHGKGDGEEPEWPPSPWRLFQSLLAGSLAGCRKSGWPDARAEAFRWLERLKEAPLIVAPEARTATAYTFYVPNNDGDKEPNRQKLLTSKVARPHRLLNGRTLHYLWPIAEEEWPSCRSHAELLSHESRHLIALGWGIDMAMGDGQVFTADEVAALKGQRWKPWEGVWLQKNMLRVPVAGSLDNLEQSYESLLSSVAGRRYQPRVEPHVFRKVHYLCGTRTARRPYVSFELRRTDDSWATFRHVDVFKVAAMLRHVAWEAAKHDSHEFPGGTERYVAGHAKSREDRSPRFSYLPLPTTRRGYADGIIRRVLIAEPFGGDGSQAHWATKRLLHSPLVNEAGQEQALLYYTKAKDAVIRSYVPDEPSRMWSSITPVILPGFDDGKYKKAERLLIKAMQQADLPAEALEAIVLRKAPFWPGSQHPNLYQRPEYLRDLSAWHVHLRFRDEIHGPLSIGSGRHCGLGLFGSEESPRQS
jgi:CRISPR-associated protein Csb2